MRAVRILEIRKPMNKLDRLIRFDEVHYWLSRTSELITAAETYSYGNIRQHKKASEFNQR